MRWAGKVLLFLALLGWTAAVRGPSFGLQERPVEFSARVEPREARPGETVQLQVTATVEAPWHLYSLTLPPDAGPVPTSITLAEEVPLEPRGEFRGPPPQREYDRTFETEVEYYEGTVTFTRALKVPEDLPPGKVPLRGTVRYMVCNERSCLPPTTAEFATVLSVVAGPPRPEFTGMPGREKEGPAAPGPEDEVAAALRRGFGAFLWLAVIMGLLAVLTPCVFPMIPVTISYFTKQAGQSRVQMVKLAAAYAGGISLTYTGLGILLALTLGAAGTNRFAANPYVNLFIAALFFTFALSLFGLFELQLPASWVTYFDRHSQRGGYLGVLVMGFTFTLVAFTCTVQFVGLLLVAAAHGEWTWPIAGMLVYSAAFSFPFFLLALFPQFLAALPQGSGGLNTTKVVLGFVELAAAFKFLSNADLVWQWQVLTRPVMLSAWVVIFACLGIYLLGKIRLPHEAPAENISIGRLLLGMLSLAFALYLSRGLFGARLANLDAYLPPAEYGQPFAAETSSAEAQVAGEPLEWLDSYEEGLARARAEGRPVFLDFTGYTCTNCRWMETNIFARPRVQQLLRRFVLVRLYTDSGPHHLENQQLQEERFGSVALPLYVIVSPAGEELARAPYTPREEDFVRFLREGWERYR